MTSPWIIQPANCLVFELTSLQIYLKWPVICHYITTVINAIILLHLNKLCWQRNRSETKAGDTAETVAGTIAWETGTAVTGLCPWYFLLVSIKYNRNSMIENIYSIKSMHRERLRTDSSEAEPSCRSATHWAWRLPFVALTWTHNTKLRMWRETSRQFNY